MLDSQNHNRYTGGSQYYKQSVDIDVEGKYTFSAYVKTTSIDTSGAQIWIEYSDSSGNLTSYNYDDYGNNTSTTIGSSSLFAIRDIIIFELYNRKI